MYVNVGDAVKINVYYLNENLYLQTHKKGPVSMNLVFSGKGLSLGSSSFQVFSPCCLRWFYIHQK